MELPGGRVEELQWKVVEKQVHVSQWVDTTTQALLPQEGQNELQLGFLQWAPDLGFPSPPASRSGKCGQDLHFFTFFFSVKFTHNGSNLDLPPGVPPTSTCVG